jgi:hypothetical protein
VGAFSLSVRPETLQYLICHIRLLQVRSIANGDYLQAPVSYPSQVGIEQVMRTWIVEIREHDHPTHQPRPKPSPAP